MLLRRWPVLRALLLITVAAAIGAGVRLQSLPATPVRIEPDVAYVVGTADGAAVLDLSFEANSRYHLIVASLGDFVPDGAFPVRLSAQDVPAIESQPLQRLATPLRRPHPADDGDRLPPSDNHSAGPSPVGTARERSFFIHVTDGDLDDPRQYAHVTSRLVREGRTVRVYLDRQIEERRLASGLVDEILRLCDDDVLPALEAHLGPCRDVDGDGRLAILLSPWLGALQGGRTSIGGFVRSADFRSDLAPPISNRSDILYMNTSLSPGPHLKTLLAHELTHAACVSARLASAGQRMARPDEEDWVSEGLAHLSENRFGDGWSNLDYRAREFLHHPAQFPLAVPDYYRSGLWRNHGCRGATWLFHRWCADEFGDEVARRLIRGAGAGKANLEQATGARFDDLFRRWTLSLLRSTFESTTTKYGAREIVGGYRTVDLCGSLGRYALAGPRIDAWDVDRPAATLPLAGTSAALLDVTASRGAGIRRLRIHAPPSARLQVTLVKCRDDRPRIELEAFWAPASASDGPDARKSQPLVVTVRSDRPCGPLRVESIMLDGDSPGESSQVSWNAREALPVFSDAETGAGPAGATSSQRFVVGAAGLRLHGKSDSETGGTMLKVVLRSQRGQRFVAWTGCPPLPSRFDALAVRVKGQTRGL